MSYITLKCKNCGSGMSINPDSKSCTCTHCGSTFLMVDLLDEQDMNFSKTITQENLQNKIDFAQALKKGETLLYQAEYKLAEESFKRAIELNDTNYKGYLGVVKAKTSNLNKIPDTPEYKEYIKLACKYVDRDNEIYLKSELAKLDLLEREHNIQVREAKKKQAEIKNRNRAKRDSDKFWGKVTTTLIVVMTVMIFACIHITKAFYPKDEKKNTTTYEIATAEKFIEYSKNEDFLSATINITEDIDFEDLNWSPIGTISKPFTGKFNGNGHTISNLKISTANSQSTYFGFFGNIKNATISNTKFEDIDISGTASASKTTTHTVGFISGKAVGSKIEKCEVSQSCMATLTHQMNCSLTYGGIVGDASQSKISYSYSNATLNSNYSVITSQFNVPIRFYIGGIAGYATESSFKNCYSTSSLISIVQSFENKEFVSYAGGIVGYNLLSQNTTAQISKCYFGGSINTNLNTEVKAHYVSGIVGYGANFSQMSNNFALFNKNYQANQALQVIDLFDYTTATSVIRYVPPEQLQTLIYLTFKTEVWENTTTLTPSIKF